MFNFDHRRIFRMDVTTVGPAAIVFDMGSTNDRRWACSLYTHICKLYTYLKFYFYDMIFLFCFFWLSYARKAIIIMEMRTKGYLSQHVSSFYNNYYLGTSIVVALARWWLDWGHLRSVSLHMAYIYFISTFVIIIITINWTYFFLALP